VLSVRRTQQLAVLALGGAFAAGSLAGCSTTQEKAAAQQAESARILKARDKRQERKRHQAKHDKEQG
jgi:glycerol kinase